MGKRKRLDEMSQQALEAKLKSLRSRRAQAPKEYRAMRRHLWRAENRVIEELERRQGRE
jgi:hypothetical protein